VGSLSKGKLHNKRPLVLLNHCILITSPLLNAVILQLHLPQLGFVLLLLGTALAGDPEVFGDYFDDEHRVS
jgi:hypothetical protein